MATNPFLACRLGLENLCKTSPSAFRDLFHVGKLSRGLAKSLRFDEGPFCELGLVENGAEQLRATVAITQYDGTFIATDFIHNRALDRVFPVYPDESYLLALWPKITKRDVVLDLCTGSGIIAIIAKKRGAARVLASDITERSKKFFDLNVQLNACSDIEFVHSDALAEIPEDSFTLVTCNPPFVPVPDGASYFVHSAGGTLGTELIEKILERTEALRRKARLYMTCLSLGSQASWRIEYLCEKLGARSAANMGARHFLPVYSDNAVPFSRYLEALPDHLRVEAWSDSIQRSYEYDRIGYFGLAIDADGDEPPATRLDRAIAALRRSSPFGPLGSYCWSMANRLHRYNAHAARV